MNRFDKVVVLALLGIVASVAAMHTHARAVTRSQEGAGLPGEPAIRILQPAPGEKITSNYVDVRFELARAGSVPGTPNFQIQLDDHDPVKTSSTEQSFTGLLPGTHTVWLQVVDANNTPLAGTQTSVEFIVLPPKPDQAATNSPAGGTPVTDSSTSLPLLAIIGFGVLAGGITSAIRAR
ncbi:MAG TPA: hypothetical protein VFA76_10865 [Terriglobales bacterium]|nr:hypothetical protein [Terriglobales bacterium]